MKSISLKELKQDLSKYTEEAAKGQPIEITRYNKPFIYLTPAAHSALHIGNQVGKYQIVAVAHRATRGKFLNALLEDREEDGE